jgi:hypothetical protein
MAGPVGFAPLKVQAHFSYSLLLEARAIIDDSAVRNQVIGYFNKAPGEEEIQHLYEYLILDKRLLKKTENLG